jgi:fumarate reductase flavoprotein subunit
MDGDLKYAGNDTGGFESNTYNVLLPGSTYGYAINSGRIAGESAAKYILTGKPS